MTIFTIPLTKLGQTLEVDTSRIPAASLESVIYNGLKQMLNDTLAGKDKQDKAFAEKLLAKVMAGVYVHSDLAPEGAKRERGLKVLAKTLDLAAFAREFCKAEILKKLAKAKIEIPDEARLAALVTKNLAATNEAAEAYWLSARAAGLDLDLGDFLEAGDTGDES